MIRRFFASTPQNPITIIMNLVALALIMASITLLGTGIAGLVAAAACVLLGMSIAYSQQLARSRMTATTR